MLSDIQCLSGSQSFHPLSSLFYIPSKEHRGRHRVNRQPAPDVHRQGDARVGRLVGGAMVRAEDALTLGAGVKTVGEKRHGR